MTGASTTQVLPSPGRGLGLFASESFTANDEILASNYRSISGTEMRVLRDNDIDLALYLFADRSGVKVSPDTCEYHYVFGPIPMLNHSNSPNCALVWDEEGSVKTVRLLAKMEIKQGDELFIEYENLHVFPDTFV
ncbi:SET domain-containing protein [uncultured Ruegeria sp.]|uniref:SET domain-containing protein-lysine N-methyltransferase n=1 Tax=uncultured Ruegeria sp. TaxID=259304 RepID=UPI00261E1475|nr:SET domain-containing protein [uncultured Ruegeria sp.]